MLKIFLEKRVLKDVHILPIFEQNRIFKNIYTILVNNPFSRGKNPKKLSGLKACRLRVGNYRVLYKITGRQIMIFKIDHKKNVYR